MSKRILVSFILIALSFGMNAHSFDIPDFPFIFTYGEAERKVPPDIATISFKVQQYDENAEKALDTVQKRCAELVVFLAEQQISKNDIVAYQIDKRAVRERKDNSFNDLKILGYEITRNFSVKLKKLSRYEQIVKNLLSFKNVVYVSTIFDSTDRKKIVADLIAEASSNAKSQAELMAAGFGAKLESVFSISQEDFRKISDAEFSISSPISLAAGYEGLGKGLGLGMGMSSAEFEKIKLQQQAGEFLFVPSVITMQKDIKVIFKLKTAPSK